MLLPLRSKVEAMGAWVRYKAVGVLLKRDPHTEEKEGTVNTWEVIHVAGAGRNPRKRERLEILPKRY